MNHTHTLLSEQFRLRALKQTGVIPRNVSFIHGDLALLSVELDMPVCAASIVGKHFTHIKAAVGTDLTLIHRDHAFCSLTIMQDEPLVIEDTASDPRFADNPYVVDGPRIRFYAGAPFRTIHGLRLGAVCVMDDKPRTLTAKARDRLMASAIRISENLAFNEADWSLEEMSTLHILETLRQEDRSGNEAKIIELVNALYARLDRAAERARAAALRQDNDPVA